MLREQELLEMRVEAIQVAQQLSLQEIEKNKLKQFEFEEVRVLLIGVKTR